MYLKSKVLRESDLPAFQEFNSENGGAPVDMDYLRKARIRVFFQAGQPNVCVAGYAVNTAPPFRYLSVMDEELRENLMKKHQWNEKDLVEITLIVKNKQIKWTKAERFIYYAHSIYDAFLTGRSIVLGGSKNNSLAATMMTVLSKLLYKGSVNFFGKTETTWLFYEYRMEMVKNLLKSGIQLMLLNMQRSKS